MANAGAENRLFLLSDEECVVFLEKKAFLEVRERVALVLEANLHLRSDA